MTHLICAAHQRRVLVLDHVTVHREDGGHCDSARLVSGNSVRTAEQVRAVQPPLPGDDEPEGVPA